MGSEEYLAQSLRQCHDANHMYWIGYRACENAIDRELSALRALRDAVGKYLVDPDAWDHLLKECYEKAKAFDAK